MITIVENLHDLQYDRFLHKILISDFKSALMLY